MILLSFTSFKGNLTHESLASLSVGEYSVGRKPTLTDRTLEDGHQPIHNMQCTILNPLSNN